MSSRLCPKCGKRYSSSYRKCPNCSARERRRDPALSDRFIQLVDFLRQNSSQVFVASSLFFLAVAILGVLLTRSPSEPDETPAPPAPVERYAAPLALSRSSVTITEGETAVLSASGNFDTLIWTSSDESVVSVSSGRITANAAGTAVVTASTGVESRSCEVTVQEAVPVSQFVLALNYTDFTLRAGDPPVQMAVKIKGTKDPYTGEVVWASQNPETASISETGLVERVGKGSTVIPASADGQTLECIVRVR